MDSESLADCFVRKKWLMKSVFVDAGDFSNRPGGGGDKVDDGGEYDN